jgi:hypothetical protein
MDGTPHDLSNEIIALSSNLLLLQQLPFIHCQLADAATILPLALPLHQYN